MTLPPFWINREFINDNSRGLCTSEVEKYFFSDDNPYYKRDRDHHGPIDKQSFITHPLCDWNPAEPWSDPAKDLEPDTLFYRFEYVDQERRSVLITLRKKCAPTGESKRVTEQFLSEPYLLTVFGVLQPLPTIGEFKQSLYNKFCNKLRSILVASRDLELDLLEHELGLETFK